MKPRRDERDTKGEQKREKIPWPSPLAVALSHGVKDRFPGIRFDVGAVVLIEALARAAVQASNPECFLHSQVVFEALRIFVAATGKYFRSPVYWCFAVFFVLSETFFVFQGANVDGSTST